MTNHTALRERLATELDTLAPMPDLTGQVIRTGTGIRRRRRLAAGSLLGVAAVTGGAILTQWPVGDDARVSDPSVAATPTPTEEWVELVRSTLDELLPAEYDVVTPADRPGNDLQPRWQVRGPEGELYLQLAVRVPDQGRLVHLTSEQFEHGSCDDRQVGDWTGLACRFQVDSGTPWSTLELQRPRVRLSLDVYRVDGSDGPVGLSPSELLDLAESPGFTALADHALAHADQLRDIAVFTESQQEAKEAELEPTG